MRTVSTMQAGRHDNLMLSAASCPPLQRTQGWGAPVMGYRNEKQRMGHLRRIDLRRQSEEQPQPQLRDRTLVPCHPEARALAGRRTPCQPLPPRPSTGNFHDDTQEPALSVVEGTGHPRFRNGKEKPSVEKAGPPGPDSILPTESESPCSDRS